MVRAESTAMEAREGMRNSSAGDAVEHDSPAGVLPKTSTCPAFFIGGDSESDTESCPASSTLDDESDAESCQRLSRGSHDLSFGASDATSTTASSAVEGHSQFQAPWKRHLDNKLDHSPEWKQLELFFCLAIKDLVGTFSEETSGLRKELRSLADGLEHERNERLAAVKHSEKVADRLALALDKECSERLSDLKRLSEECRGSLTAGVEEMGACNPNIDELSWALDKETQERVALEVSIRQALQMLQEDFDEEVAQRTRDVKDLKRRLDKDFTVFKAKSEEQDKLVAHINDVLEEADRERRHQSQDFEHVKLGLMKLRVDVDGVRQSMNRETTALSKLLDTEGKERQGADADIRHQLEKLETKVNDVVQLNEACADLNDVCDELIEMQRIEEPQKGLEHGLGAWGKLAASSWFSLS